MGLLCGKQPGCCCCCCPAAAAEEQLEQQQRFKLLLLGVAGSGKTQLGHLLSGRQRADDDRSATNGVRCYQLQQQQQQSEFAAVASITEVGGSAEMQRLWPHYYASSHALIYCYDIGGSYEQLRRSFELLQRCLQHAALRGKPVLLVASRDSESVQLYDIEHAFNLEQLARGSNCPLHLCHMLQPAQLRAGMQWLLRLLQAQAPALAQRIKYDLNLMSWQQRKRTLLSSSKLAQVHRQRFHRAHRKV
ncbi:CG11356 [Drosophila busckii]|uniref:CG11356 n=1 Tax=Drosophila busckii TaxID=30019 RepID=A0A0M3QZC4_DROBS|nr:CG11356 [Drosophila busckii]